MEKGKREVRVCCIYANDNENVKNILLKCFHSYIYKEIQKGSVF